MAFQKKLKTLILVFVLFGLGALVNCTSNRVTPTVPSSPVSTSEVVAAIISGTINVTSPLGTQTRNELRPVEPRRLEKLWAWLKKEIASEAQAQITSAGNCPNLQGVTSGTTCAVNNNIITFAYQTCNFVPQPLGVLWQGSMSLTSMSSSAPVTFACGSFPTFAAGNTLIRTFGSPTDRILLNVPANSASGAPTLGVLLDTSGNSFGVNPTIKNTGITIAFTSAISRSIVINGIHIGGNAANYNVFDYELYTDGTGITVNGSNQAVSGTVNVVDMKSNATVSGQTVSRAATSTITSTLQYSQGCCLPTQGTITTSWNDSTPTETLTFSGTCNQGQLTSQGATRTVTLTQCY